MSKSQKSRWKTENFLLFSAPEICRFVLDGKKWKIYFGATIQKRRNETEIKDMFANQT